MGFVKNALKSAVLLKVLDTARREAAKPQNQARARRLLARMTDRTSGGRARSGRAWSSPKGWSRTTTGRWSAARRPK